MSDRVLSPNAESQLVYDPVEPTIDEKSICRTAFVRVYAEPAFGSKRRSKQKWCKTTWEKDRFLVFDTETVENVLTFGAFECWEKGDLKERGVFYNDDPYKGLHKKDIQKLADLCNELGIGVPQPASYLFKGPMNTVRDFGGVVGGFNLSYDLSRLASRVAKACKSRRTGSRYLNGFEFYRRFRGRAREIVDWLFLKIKRDDRFKTRFGGMRNARVLEEQSLYKALTDRADTLEGACRMFNVDFDDRPGEHIGIITRDNVAGCLHDAKKTRELCKSMLEEYNRHPISLPVHQALSPASMIKSYLYDYGILPRLEHQPDFPKEYLGYASMAYHGGRVETPISRTLVPCLYLDALSMYPTVFDLLDLWKWVIADRLEPVEIDPQEAQRRIELVRENPGLLNHRSNWPQFSFFAEVEAFGAHLPTRTTLPKLEDYAYSTEDQTTCFGPVTTGPNTSIWVTGLDLAAAYLQKRGSVRIKRAWTLVPHGVMPTVKDCIPFRGECPIDPRRENLFKLLIELRKQPVSDPTDEKQVRDRELRDTGFKCMANSGAYGIWIETNPVDVDPEIENRKPRPVNVWADRSFRSEVDRPEKHGRYCFPPIASLVTGGARLLLAYGQRQVEDEGGHIAYCDTDSLVIVASEEGGLVPCEGGEHQDSEGRQCIRALSYEQVDGILEHLKPLNPYDRTVVPGSVFKKESVVLNASGRPKQLWFYGVRDKKYVVCTRDERGGVETIVKASSHGDGVYRSPIKGDRVQKNGVPQWLEIAYKRFLHTILGLPTERPKWFDYPATMRVSLTTWNAYKHYMKTCFPFGIVTAFSVLARFKEDLCCDNPRPAAVGLVEPGKTDGIRCVCLSCGQRVRDRDDAGNSYFKTYGEVIGNSLVWGFQRKRLAASGAEPTVSNPAVGLTIPRPVCIEKIRYIGKEVIVDTSEAPIEEGQTAEELVATPTLEYVPLATQEAQRMLAENVARVSEIAGNAGVHRRTIERIRNGQKPQEKTARELVRAYRAIAPPDGRVDNNDEALRNIVRAVGVKRVAGLAGLSPRTLSYFVKGRRPHKPSLNKIRAASLTSLFLNLALGADDASVRASFLFVFIVFLAAAAGWLRKPRRSR